MAKAYLHIGMPKTGTTAIQCFLRDNREELKKQGFCYPDFGYAYPKVGAHRNGYFVSRVDNLYEKEREGSYRKLDKLANQRVKGKGETVSFAEFMEKLYQMMPLHWF